MDEKDKVKIDHPDVDYQVRLVGTDEIADITIHGWPSAQEMLTQKFNNSLKKHNNGSWFEEADLNIDDGNFMITGEEYFQYGYIVPVNNKPGFLHTIEEIRRCADRAGAFAQCYQYELNDMQGVYDDLFQVIHLAGELEDELTKKHEQSYIDQLDALTSAVLGDAAIPEADKKRADFLISQLQNLLWKYYA